MTLTSHLKTKFIIITFMISSCSCLKSNDAFMRYHDIVEENAPTEEIIEEEPSPKSKSENIDFIYRIECPEPSENAQNIIVIKKDDTYGVNYALEWDCSKRAQRWTAYQMYSGNTCNNVRRSGDDAWHEDDQIPSEYRTTYADHYRNGYDRGHMIASADRLESRAMNRMTFCYSNVHPQLNTLNAGVWMEMEEKLRSWNNDDFRDTLYVVKGGTIDNELQILERTPAGLIVPQYFYMAILCIKDGKYKAMAFWIEHKSKYTSAEHKLVNYVISIDQLETFTGINFFYNLPLDIEQEVESETIVGEWKF